MKYQLETIPVWEAYESGADCALCHLENHSEERNTEFFLGSSIMAPEMRVKLNERGFCTRHLLMLGRGTGKLGLSLALATHLQTLDARLGKSEARLARASGKSAGKIALELAEHLDTQRVQCLMCDRITHNLVNYSYTIAKLFETEPEFRSALADSRGFCHRHLPLLLRMGVEVLRGEMLCDWHCAIGEAQAAYRRALRADLEAFSRQFDYQSEKKTPPHAADAVPRTIGLLAGFGPDR